MTSLSTDFLSLLHVSRQEISVVGKRQEKSPFGRSREELKENSKTNQREIKSAKVLIEFNWLRLGPKCMLLWTQWWNFGFHRRGKLLLQQIT